MKEKQKRPKETVSSEILLELLQKLESEIKTCKPKRCSSVQYVAIKLPWPETLEKDINGLEGAFI